MFIDHWRGWNNAGWYALGAASGAALGAEFAGPRYAAPYYPPPYYPPVASNPCPPGYWLGPWGHCRDTPYHGRLPDGQWQ
ncbi:GCG_CRPN prefix-to-repeats domain-containing protein [Rhizobium grahamii]|uniref:GCG_CRPN prefix-to-repeats domain-containing protein n=1 Tax=Rhizobium grahamii TaxID=1120045 RepID=UPI003D7C22E4